MPDRGSYAKTKRTVQQYTSRMIRKGHPSNITLADVLSGDTCDPISLKNFEAYLAHKEHTLEILQFVVWFQDYRARFLALPEHIQACSPGPKAFNFTIPSPARTAQRVAESKQRAEAYEYTDGAPMAPGPSCSTAGVRGTDVYPRFSVSHGTGYSSMMAAPLLQPYGSASIAQGSPTLRPGEQPFRAECMRVVATFFKPGAAKELPLDPVLRDTVIRDLTWNAHPDIFIHVYEEMCDMLERTSLPRFLALAATNINRPKQLFWYAVGLADTLLGAAVAVALITAVPVPPQARRAWRLFSVPLVVVGLMQMYSAWRGFCSQVWGLGHTQLRVWEMQEMDEEAAAHWERVLMHDGGGGDQDKRVQMIERGDPDGAAPAAADGKHDIDAIAPFSSYAETDSGPPSPSESDIPSRPLPFSKPRSNLPTKRTCFSRAVGFLSSQKGQTDSRMSSSGLDSLGTERRHPSVFGPEKVVLDPRIQALHRQVMRDMFYFGFWCALISSCLVCDMALGLGDI